MVRIKRITLSVLGVVFSISIAALTQIHISNVRAANTISGSENEIITIKTSDGLPINASYSIRAYSSDGDIILFTSTATNLPNISTAPQGLYVYSIKENLTQRVDISTGGVPGDKAAVAGIGGNPYKLSETGRYVVFPSIASNLIDGASVAEASFYIRDIQTGTTTLLRKTTSPTTLSSNYDFNLGVSNDGRFTLFASRYFDNSTGSPYKIHLHDTEKNTAPWMVLPFSDGGGVAGDYTSFSRAGSMSCDGSFITYNGNTGLILLDLRNGLNKTTIVGNHTSQVAAISCSGRYVIYSTRNRTDISPTPTGLNSNYHLVRYDRITGERIYIDSNSAGVFGTGKATNDFAVNMFGASVSDKGDVVFQDGGYSYLKHLSDGSGTLESIAKNANGASVNIAAGELVNNGQFIFYRTDPYNLGLASAPSSTQLIRAKTNL